MSSQIAIKYFKKENIAGNLIFVLSTYGIVGPDLEIYKDLKAKNNIYNSDDPLTTPAVYSSTKSGLLGLARYIAKCFTNAFSTTLLNPDEIDDTGANSAVETMRTFFAKRLVHIDTKIKQVISYSLTLVS